MSTTPGTPNTDYQPLSFDQAIQFYWDVPNDGGSPILDYRLTLNYSGGSLVYTPAATDITFLATGLTNAVTYSASLEARNANGYSAVPGTYREWQAGFKPGPPSTVTVTPVGTNGAFIAWTPPIVSPLAPIYWYVIEAYSTNSSVPAMYSANGLTQSNFFISGLNSNLAYYFDVYSVNYPDYSAPVRTNTIQYLLPFQPNYIPGMSMWLDGRDPLNTGTAPANGTSITTWFDKSGQGNNGTSAGTTPTYSSTEQTLNMSLNSFFTTAYSASQSNESVFVVFKRTSSSPNPQTLLDPNANGGRNLFIDAGTLVAGSRGVANATSTTNVITLNNMFIATLIITNTVWDSWINSANTSVSGTRTLTTGLTTNIGQNNNTVNYIYEVNCYNQSLTPFNRQKVEGYLAWKWGLQSNLPTSHPFRAAAPLSNSVFSPTSFTNLQFWLDASQLTGFTNGQALTTWIDRSSNAYSGTAVGGPTYQINVINSLPIVRFNGTSQYVNFGNVLNMGVSSLNIFAVYKQSTTGTSAVFGKTSFRGNAGRWALLRDTTTYFLFEGSSGGTTAGYSDSSTSFQINSGGWDRTTITIFQNGTSAGTASLVNSANLSNSDPLVVGAYPNSSGGFPPQYYMNGDIAELLVYNRALSTPDRQTVEGYLAWKWGLQNNLPSTHPYRFNNPAQVITPITPTLFNNLQMWLDASDLSTFTLSNVSTVTRWADKSGNGFNYGTGRGTVILSNDGGRQVTYYNGSSDLVISSLTSFNTNSGATIAFAVAKLMGNGATLWGYTSNDKTIRYGSVPSTLNGGPGIGGGNNEDWGQNTYFVNGSQNTTNSNTYITYHEVDAYAQFSLSGSEMRVGGWRDGTRQWTGTIAEILVYSSMPSASDRQTIQGYLTWKWGLQNTLPYTHPYKFLNPISPLTTTIASAGLSIEFDANIYGGGGFWPNTGSLSQANNAIPTNTVTKNAAGNGVVFNQSLFYSFPNVYNTDLTLSAWYKRTTTTIAAGESAILAQQLGSGNTIAMSFGVGSVTSNVQFARFNSSTWAISAQTVGTTIGQWVHIVMSYTSPIVTTYSNGVSLGSTNVGSLANGGQWFIGRNWNSTNPINGEIGQILIYNRALSAAEVLQNYTATSNVYSV